MINIIDITKTKTKPKLHHKYEIKYDFVEKAFVDGKMRAMRVALAYPLNEFINDNSITQQSLLMYYGTVNNVTIS